MINTLFGLLFPSLIGVKQCNIMYGEIYGIRKIIERYLGCILFINTFSYGITIYIFKQPNFVFTNQFTFKYIVLSIVVAYVIPIIGKILNDYIHIDIKVKKNEK